MYKECLIDCSQSLSMIYRHGLTLNRVSLA